ncbi:retinal pigment epithelial membrane protein-domain-containing protein [Phlyctochytrium arcticum]|nr:retinal pigment epithelial membrane protein-domain-containing protein [Phlyctochytrium arcticum]
MNSNTIRPTTPPPTPREKDSKRHGKKRGKRGKAPERIITDILPPQHGVFLEPHVESLQESSLDSDVNEPEFATITISVPPVIESGGDDELCDEETDAYAPAIRAATGEVVPILGSVLPTIGTTQGLVDTAKATMRVADDLGKKLGAGSLEARNKELRGQLEEQERDEHLTAQRQTHGRHEQQASEDNAESEPGLQTRAHATWAPLPSQVDWQEDEPQLSAIKNVSQRIDPALYNPSVPYIAGFSNGVEIADPILLRTKVSTKFPKWLKGVLYRNGPGLFDLEYIKDNYIGAVSFKHWFDGLPLVHRFELDGGTQTVQYRSRFMSKRLESLVRKHAADRRLQEITNVSWLGLNTMKSDPMAVSVNMAINPHFPLGHHTSQVDHVVLSTDSSLLQEIDAVTLNPKQALEYKNINPAFLGQTAAGRCMHDDEKGCMINYTMRAEGSRTATYTFFQIMDNDFFDPPGHVIASMQAPLTHAHFFALTEHYIVLVCFPYKMNWKMGVRNAVPWIFGAPPATPSSMQQDLQFDSEGTTTFHVVDRNRREQVCVFESGPCFALNMVNSFESSDGQNIYIDMNAYHSDEILRCWQLQNLRTEEMPPFPEASVRRYCLTNIAEASILYKSNKTKNQGVSFTHRTDYSLEWPRINPKFQSRRYQYAWGLTIDPHKRRLTNVIWDTIVKSDLDGTILKEWRCDGCYPGEPVMVPKPNGSHEDDGVILSVVLDTHAKNTSFLLMLNASNMAETARVTLPFHIPFGFYGAWTGKLKG